MVISRLPSGAAVRDFLRSEAIGGLALVIAAAVAILWANLGDSYFTFWHTEFRVSQDRFHLPENLHDWINDGLMVLFFFVVSLEIKRELVEGELNDPRRAGLPVLAAFGGAILPAIIFLLIVGGSESKGWGIPMATDIAFAVGVLTLLGRRVPLAAKVLLLSIAIVDDVIAIVVIAVFYTEHLAPLWLLVAAVCLVAMWVLRGAGVARIVAYIPLGLAVWFAVLQSGVHPTIAGVAIGLMTPTRLADGRTLLDDLEHRLHPFTSLLIVPLFALANAGIAFGSEMLRDATADGLAFAIAIGLVLGKLIGISGTVALAVRTGFGALSKDLRPRHVLGIAALGGIGFTVSLFIAQLSFTDPETVDIAKLGIFAGSGVAALLGLGILATGQSSDRSRGSLK